jgi:hypothetical protein
MASTEDLAPETPSGTTRRTVLKAAGHAAWMIPAVQIASQVPAMAAASDILTIAAQGSKTTSGSLVISGVKVKNSSTTDATTNLTATLTFTVGSGNATSATVSGVPTEWSAASSSVAVGAGKKFSVSFSPSAQLAIGATAPALGATLAFNKDPNSITAVAVTFSSPNFSSATANP